MDANQLFWATGIDNTKLNTNVNEAVAIFQRLSNEVKAKLEEIERYYDKVQLKANLKFTNPVDPSMVASIREQMSSLGKVIDDQTNRVANMSLTYDKAMSKINSSTSKLGKGVSSASPIKESVDNVKADVARADKELSFLERRFKYAASSIIAYGSFRWGKQFIDDMIAVKGEFDQLRVAIDSFTGSSEKGAEIFGQLTRLAVKSPFELRDITNSAKQLLAYGTAADDVTNSVKMLSDVSAGSGQSIKDIAYLYGTSLTQGRLYARDLFQFANRGIPIYGELAKVMGVSTEKLMQMTKAGKVGFPELQKAFENMTAAGGKYYGLSDKLAETTYGKISNLKDKWSIALNEMGTETDGIVSTGVEGITALIANWEEVAKAIEGVVLAYGSYKAATAVGALVAGVETYAANYREAESLNILTTAQQRADLAKKGFVLGSVEYTAAIKAEAAAQLQNAQKALAAVQIEVTANEALLASKQQLSIALGEEVIARRVALDAAKSSGTIAQIETAQTELNNISKEHSIAIEESRTIAKTLNTVQTEKQILADKVELIATVSDTAAKAVNTGTTDLLTLAKIKLTAISAKLNAVMAANPWTVAAIAIGLLVYAVWELYDATTDAEKAQKRINDTIGNQNRALEETRQKTKDLIEVVMSETSTMYDKQEAMQQLQLMMPSVFKNMDIEKVKLMGLVDLNKELNKEINRRSEIGVKTNIVLAKDELDQLKKRRDMPTNAWDITRQSLEPTEYKNYINGLINIQNEYINKLEKNLYKIGEIKKKAEFSSLPKQQQIQSLSINKKAIESEIRDLEDRKKVAQKNNEFFSEQYKLTEKRKQLSQIESQIGSLTSKDSKKIKDKYYWGDIKKNAEEERDAMDISEVNGKRWNELVEQERNADKQLAAWDSSKKIDSAAEKAKTKAQKEAERQAKLVQEQNRLNNEILQNKEKLADASKQAELDRAQAEIDVLEDGYSKKQAQIEANYNREIAKVKEKGDELLKVQQKIAYDQWLIANPNWVKEKKSFTMPTTLSPDNQKTVTSLTGTAEKNRANESKKMYEKLLVDLQNFDQQRIEIDKKYNDQVEFLTKSRTENNKKEVDDAIAQAQRLAEEEKAKLSLEEFKKNFDWETIFGNLNIYSTNRLKELRAELKKLIETDRGLPESDKSELIKQYNKLGDAIIKDQESLTGLFNFRTEQQDQIRLLQEEYDMRKKNYDMLVQEQNQLSANYSLNKLNLEQFLKNNGLNSDTSSINSDSISSFFTKKGDSQGLSQFQNLFSLFNQSGSQLSNIMGKVQLAGQSMNNASGALKGAGGSMSGTMSMIDTIIHKINDSVQSLNELMKILGAEDTKFGRGMDSFAKSSEYATKAWDSLKSGNPIGVITGVVGSIKEAGNAIDTWFGSDTTARYEKLKKELESYMDVLDKVIDKQKKSMDGLVGTAALAAQKELEDTINKQIESYRKLAEAAGKAGASAGSHSYAVRTNKKLKGDWDEISKSAGKTIDSIDDLYSLSSEQLEKIMTDNPLAWSKINGDIRGYLESIIEAGDSITESIDQANEALLGLSFDSAKDGLDDLLKSADTTMSDIADNFEDYMRTAMLNTVKSGYLTKALTDWYADFVDKTKSGDELTPTEIDQLRQAYVDIYKNAQSQYDALLDAADITLTGSANSTSGAISSMSQESADILTAQFSAIRINVSDILLTLQSERPLLELAFNDIAEIARNTRDLADIKRLIGDIKDYGVKMK